MTNKKVLLRERKRHTARRVASTCCATLSPGGTYPGWGVPTLDGGTYPGGKYLPWSGGYRPWTGDYLPDVGTPHWLEGRNSPSAGR